jgi:hypothetical protein
MELEERSRIEEKRLKDIKIVKQNIKQDHNADWKFLYSLKKMGKELGVGLISN